MNDATRTTLTRRIAAMDREIEENLSEQSDALRTVAKCSDRLRALHNDRLQLTEDLSKG